MSDNSGMYEPLDIQTPQLLLWLGIIFVVVGGAIAFHAGWRRRRAAREAAGQGAIYEGADSRIPAANAGVDARFELLAGAVMLVLGAGGIVAGAVANTHQVETMTENVAQKYPPVTEVNGHTWQGNQLDADLVLEDGTEYQDVQIIFDADTGEPTITGEWPGLTESE